MSQLTDLVLSVLPYKDAEPAVVEHEDHVGGARESSQY